MLSLNAIEVVQKDDKEALASYSISWQPPLYLGGLNLADIKYNVIISKKDNRGIITTDTTNNTYFRIPILVHVKPTLIKTLHIKVFTINTQVESKYLPSNVLIKAIYNRYDLINTAIGKLCTCECTFKANIA